MSQSCGGISPDGAAGASKSLWLLKLASALCLVRAGIIYLLVPRRFSVYLLKYSHFPKMPVQLHRQALSMKGWGKCQNSTEWYLKQALAAKDGKSGGNIFEPKLAQTSCKITCSAACAPVHSLALYLCLLDHISTCWHIRPDAEEDSVIAVILCGYASVYMLGVRLGIWMAFRSQRGSHSKKTTTSKKYSAFFWLFVCLFFPNLDSLNPCSNKVHVMEETICFP